MSFITPKQRAAVLAFRRELQARLVTVENTTGRDFIRQEIATIDQVLAHATEGVGNYLNRFEELLNPERYRYLDQFFDHKGAELYDLRPMLGRKNKPVVGSSELVESEPDLNKKNSRIKNLG